MPYTKYKELPRHMISEGVTLPFEVLIYLSDQKAPVIFTLGTTLCTQDIERLEKYPEGRLIIKKDEYLKYVEDGAILQIAEDLLEKKEIKDEQLKDVYAHVLEKEENMNWQDYFSQTMHKSQGIVTSFLSNSQNPEKTVIVDFLSKKPLNHRNVHEHAVELISFGGFLLLSCKGIDQDFLVDFAKLAILHTETLGMVMNTPDKCLLSQYLKEEQVLIKIDREFEAAEKMTLDHLTHGIPSNKEHTIQYVKHFYIMEKIVQNISFWKKRPHLLKVIKQVKTMSKPVQMRTETFKGNPHILAKAYMVIDTMLSKVNGFLLEDHSIDKNLYLSSLDSLKDQKYFDGSKAMIDEEMIEHFKKKISEVI